MVQFCYLNPTKLNPMPKPVPDRADCAMTGVNVSRVLKVAAAVSAIKGKLTDPRGYL